MCNYGDETQVSYVSSTATLKDVDEDGKTVRSRIQRWRPMRLTMSRRWVAGTNTVIVGIQRGVGGGSTNGLHVGGNNADGVSNTVSGYTVSGSTVTLTLDTDVQPGDETQVSYVSSTATLKDVDEDGKTVSITIQRWRGTMSRR